MANCPQCGFTNIAHARFCNDCGARLEPPCSAQQSTLPESFAGGRFQVRGLLGEGGKKRVYLVDDQVMGREVALSLVKTDGLNSAGVARIEREVQLQARLSGHPHIVTIYELGKDTGDRPWFISEVMHGGDLTRMLAAAPEGRLSPQHVVAIGAQLCLALQAAHTAGVIHRDLKPGNIWSTERGLIKLGDFGLALATGQERLSQDGTVAGTAGYMAPEQAAGDTADARSDLYALGVILYELCTGQLPYAALGNAVPARVRELPPISPSWHTPALPAALETLILQLLAYLPDDRPASAELVRSTLESIRAQEHNPVPHLSVTSTNQAGNGSPSRIFVGREREFALLRQAYDAAHTGRSNIVLLAGEPGIGKTSLAEETAAYARLRGGRALWGRCTEWPGAPPYWPWVQILRGYVHAQTDTQLANDLSYYGPYIAPVVSTVRERLPEIPEPPPAEADQARFCLFDSIAAVLRNASQREPLVLLLDDLHWADADSLLLLEFIANAPGIERARLLIVGTYRDMDVGRRHPLTKTVDSLQRVLRLQRTALQGLTPDDVARLIALTAGFEPPRALIDAIERETDGNPFFVNEVVRLLAEAGELQGNAPARGWTLAIPQSCKDAIGQRLDRLSPASNEVLSIASVIGRTFSYPVLDRVCDLSAERILDALAEARDARLITNADEPNQYRFVHALVQESLYDEIAPGERMGMHARVGEALAQLHVANLAPMDGEIGYHFANAAPIGYAEPGVTHATRAGKRAMSQFAWEAAAQQFERALHAMEFLSEPDVTQRCDLLLDLGDAQFRTVLDVSDAPVGSDAFLRAAEIARSIDSPERLAHAAIGFAGINLVRTPGGFTQTALLEAALALYPDQHSPLYARLLARLAADLRIVPGAEARIEAISRRAVSLARELGDPGVLAYALAARHVAIWGPDNLDERMKLAKETLQMGKQAGDLVMQAWAILPLAADAYETGDRALFEEMLDAQMETAQRAGIPYFIWAARLQTLSRCVLDGRFDEAERGLQQVGGNSKSLVAAYFRTLLRFLRGYAIGDLEELDEPLQEIVDLTVGQVSPFDRHRGNVAALARQIVLVQQGRRDEARAGFERFATTRMPELMKDSYWLATAVLLAEICTLLDEREIGRAHYARLLPYVDRNAAAGSGLINLGPVSRYLGMLAALDGNRSQAIVHFEQALLASEHIGALPMLALSQLELARVLIESGTPTHLARAAVLVADARATAARLEMRAPLDRCVLLAAEIERKRLERAGGNRFGLTARELEVLAKLAERCSNVQIGEALFITESTARTHVDNILGKMGVHSRTEAADLARNEGLLT